MDRDRSANKCEARQEMQTDATGAPAQYGSPEPVPERKPAVLLDAGSGRGWLLEAFNRGTTTVAAQILTRANKSYIQEWSPGVTVLVAVLYETEMRLNQSRGLPDRPRLIRRCVVATLKK